MLRVEGRTNQNEEPATTKSSFVQYDIIQFEPRRLSSNNKLAHRANETSQTSRIMDPKEESKIVRKSQIVHASIETRKEKKKGSVRTSSEGKRKRNEDDFHSSCFDGKSPVRRRRCWGDKVDKANRKQC